MPLFKNNNSFQRHLHKSNKLAAILSSNRFSALAGLPVRTGTTKHRKRLKHHKGATNIDKELRPLNTAKYDKGLQIDILNTAKNDKGLEIIP